MDNIDQHSRYTHASIMAQFFPKKNIVDIGVIDNGLSIPRLFEENRIPFLTDSEAIESALQGLSTKKEARRGYGLPAVHKITTEGLKGVGYIISRRGCIHVLPNNVRKSYILQNHIYNGTVIYLRFSAPKEKINIHPYL